MPRSAVRSRRYGLPPCGRSAADPHGAPRPLAPRARLLPSLAAVYRAQLSRARVARIPLLFVATFQSVGIMILMRGVVDGGGEARAVVAGSSVLVVAFVALNLLAQYFGQLRAGGGLDHYATLPVPPAAVVLGAAGAYASFTVPGTLVTAVVGSALFGLPLTHLWVLVAVIPLAGAALAGLGAALGLLAPRPGTGHAARPAGHVGGAAAGRAAGRAAARADRVRARSAALDVRRRGARPYLRRPPRLGGRRRSTSRCARRSASPRWPSRPGRTGGRRSGEAVRGPAWHDGRVTAPLTPPHQPPQPHDPWQHAAAVRGRPPSGPDRARTGPARAAAELRQAAVVAAGRGGRQRRAARAAVAVAGAPGAAGLGRHRRVPQGQRGRAGDRRRRHVRAAGARLRPGQRGRRLPAPQARRHPAGGRARPGRAARRRCWPGGSAIWLGPDDDVVAHAKAVGKGVTFDAPLELNAQGRRCSPGRSRRWSSTWG